jgi:hypothetical protein
MTPLSTACCPIWTCGYKPCALHRNCHSTAFENGCLTGSPQKNNQLRSSSSESAASFDVACKSSRSSRDGALDAPHGSHALGRSLLTAPAPKPMATGHDDFVSLLAMNSSCAIARSMASMVL